MKTESTNLFDQWLAIVKATRSSRTYELYSQVSRELMQLIGSPVQWGGEAITTYLNWLADKGNSPRSRNTKLQIVKSFVSWAGKAIPEQVVTSMPSKVSYMPSQPTVAKAEEVDKLLIALKHEPETTLALLLMADAGLRESEVRNLKWKHVKGNVLRVMGKGSKYRELPIPGNRLPALLGEGLDKHSPEDYIVPGASGGLISRGVIGTRISDACVRARIRKLNPHSFRHCFAVRSVKNNVATPLIQRALGHSSLETTDMYLRGLDGDLDALRAGYANFK